MPSYSQLSKAELSSVFDELNKEYEALQAKKLNIDISRGKPGADQLALSVDMLNFPEGFDFKCDGVDVRNYGVVDGLPSAKKLFAEMLDVKPEQVFVGNNSSLELMFGLVSRAMSHGVYGGETPWGKEEKVKFLCPVPGYDRHFAICEFFGIEMINIDMHDDGPDMDAIEKYVSSDSSIKGIWCVPKFSNPEGVTYSEEVINRFAALKPAAKNFRIFWDNAYCVHSFDPANDKPIKDIVSACEQSGNPDMVYEFASTSKLTFPGAGIAAIASSKANIDFIKKQISIQTVGPDKINQLRHIRYFKNLDGVMAHMEKHAAILRNKFDTVINIFEREFTESGVASFIAPKGGYFISLNTMDGTAKRIVKLAAEAGVVVTSAGATYPYGKDPFDRNIRIAPTYTSKEELTDAIEAICLCTKYAAAEALLKNC